MKNMNIDFFFDNYKNCSSSDVLKSYIGYRYIHKLCVRFRVAEKRRDNNVNLCGISDTMCIMEIPLRRRRRRRYIPSHKVCWERKRVDKINVDGNSWDVSITLVFLKVDATFNDWIYGITLFFLSEQFYKNIEPQNPPKIKNNLRTASISKCTPEKI